MNNRVAQAQRIGIFGGAFDPPHLGHVALANATIEQLQLGELIVIPTGQAWHKARGASGEMSAAAHRLAMTRLAFADIPKAQVDAREIKRVGNSYTIDTLRELQTERPDTVFFLIFGEDQFAKFETWKDWREIARMAQLVVAQRPLSEGLMDSRLRVNDGSVSMDARFHSMSSTNIRERIMTHHNNAVDDLAPSVATYIRDNHLYT